MTKLVVTRHANLILYLRELKLIDEDTKILSHAKERDVKGKHVLGVLPYWLSCLTGKYTEIQIRIPRDLKGKELTLDQIRLWSCDPQTYIVKEIRE